MSQRTEYCARCDEATGRAGRSDDSIYIEIDGEEYGPLCEDCCGIIKQEVDSWWRCIGQYAL